MMNTLKKVFGLGPSVNFEELMNEGAMILDVRTPGEYSAGNVKGSVNIPLDRLEQSLHRLKNKEQIIITCCASGMRSGVAKGVLKRNGYTRVHNGGSWYGLRHLSESKNNA